MRSYEIVMIILTAIAVIIRFNQFEWQRKITLLNLERKGYFNPTNPEITLIGCFYIVIIASYLEKSLYGSIKALK